MHPREDAARHLEHLPEFLSNDSQQGCINSFVSSTCVISQLHLHLSDPTAAYCTETELRKDHFASWSSGRPLVPLVPLWLRWTHSRFFPGTWKEAEFGLGSKAAAELCGQSTGSSQGIC